MTTFAKIEKQKSDILEMLGSWPVARLAYRPASDSWSAVEVLDHIVKVESGITDAARRGLQMPHRMGLRDRLGFLLLDRVFRSRMRVKVPSSVAEVLPDSSVSFEAVRDQWANTRADFALLLGELDHKQLRLALFRHPVSGWMSVPHILRFFSVHMRHHSFQLERILTASEREAARDAPKAAPG